MGQANFDNNPWVTAWNKALCDSDLNLDTLLEAISEHLGPLKGSPLHLDVFVTAEDSSRTFSGVSSLKLCADLIGECCVYEHLNSVAVRLSSFSLNRWIELPRGGFPNIQLPPGMLIATRNSFNQQTERFIPFRDFIDQREFPTLKKDQERITHIYIPGHRNQGVPIFPIEDVFFEEKADQKSSSETVSGKAEAECQSDPAHVDHEANAGDPEAKSKAAQVTADAQMALLMLVERIEAAGIPVFSANADGIVIKAYASGGATSASDPEAKPKATAEAQFDEIAKALRKIELNSNFPRFTPLRPYQKEYLDALGTSYRVDPKIQMTETPEQAHEALRDAQRQRIRGILSENIRALSVLGTMYDLEAVQTEISAEVKRRIGGVK